MCHWDLDLARAGKNCSHWGWVEALTPHMCISCASCSHCGPLGVSMCPDRQELRQHSELSGSRGGVCVHVCVCLCALACLLACLLLFPSSYWLLWDWEQGVGMGVSGRDVDKSSPRI